MGHESLNTTMAICTPRRLRSKAVIDRVNQQKSQATVVKRDGWMAANHKSLKRFGERGRNRTYNLLIKSQLLCQLSYAPGWNVT